MEFRVRLGQTLGTTNLVNDPVFATGCGAGNWICAAGWSIAVGVASHAGTADDLDQNNVFTFTPTLPDTVRYQINWEATNAVGAAFTQPFIGAYSSNDYAIAGNGTHQVEGKHLSPLNETFRLRGSGAIDVDNISIYNYKWNDPLEDQPSFEGTTLDIGSGFLLGSLISSFGGELIFDGDGYTYLKNIFDNLAATAFCSRIDIYIEVKNNDTWEKYFEGYIFFSDCDFDFQREQVTAKKVIGLAENATTKLKDRQVKHTPRQSLFFDIISNFITIDYRDCGAATWADTKSAHTIWRTLKATLHVASEMELTLEEDYFETTNPYYCLATQSLMTTVGAPPADDDHSIFITFDEYVTNLNAIFNMGLVERLSDTLPTLVIDLKQTLGGFSQSFILSNIDAPILRYSEQNIYSSVQIGFSDSFSTTNSVQFSAWDKFKYTSSDTCSTKSRGLVCDWIADDQVIDDLRCTGSDSTGKYIFIAGMDNAGSIEARCAGADASYNLCVETIDNMNRHVWSLQSTFINSNDNAGTATKVNNPFVKEIEFEFKITLAQLTAIRNNPNYRIPFNAPEYNLPVGTEGYIVDFSFDNTSRIAKFKLLI